jgi:hypothetical protein
MAELPEIKVTPDVLDVAGKAIAFDEVETVSYVRKPVNGSGALIDVLRRFELAGAGRKVSVKLDGAVVLAEEKEQEWRRLIAISQERIEPRLRTEAFQRIARDGGEVRIGRLRLTREGFAWGQALRPKRYPWPEFREAYYASSRIRVEATPVGNRERRVGVLFTDTPNAVLLPRLMRDCADAFRV